MVETIQNKEIPDPNNNNPPVSNIPDVKSSAQDAKEKINAKAKKNPETHASSQKIDDLNNSYQQEDSRLQQEKQNVATKTSQKLATALPEGLPPEEYSFYNKLLLQNKQYLENGLVLKPENLTNWNQVASYNELKDSSEYQKISADEPLVTDNIDGVPVILRINAMRALQAAISEIKEKKINIIFNISTSYRDITKQIQLKKDKPNFANRAGKSTHHTGGAVDIKADINTQPPEWNQFIAIMKKNNFYQTILPKEPWHFEYVPNIEGTNQNGEIIQDTNQIYNKIFFLTGSPNVDQQAVAQKLGLYTAPA